MSLYKRYELIEPIPGGTVKSFKARQISTGRDVWVHLLVGGDEALQRQVRAVAAEKRRRILEEGTHEGTPFVVTDDLGAPFEEWLNTPVAVSPASADVLTRAGQWQSMKIALPGAAEPPKVTPPAEPGLFTRMSQSPQAPAAPPQAAPGQFTRMFHAADAPAAPPEPAPGQFAEMFQPPAAAPSTAGMPQAPPPAPPEAPVEPRSPAPGEFTSFFRPGVVSPPPAQPTPGGFGVPSPRQPPPPAGNFTRMMRGSPSGSGDFGQAAPAGGGEYTQMFGRGSAPQPEALTPPAQSPAAPKKAGDFTRMFEAPAAAPPPPVPPAPATPPVAQPQYAAPQFQPPQFQPPQFQAPQAQPPQMQAPQFQAPHLQQPQFPPPAPPSAPAPARPPNYLPLVIIMGALLVIAILLVVYFALR